MTAAAAAGRAGIREAFASLSSMLYVSRRPLASMLYVYTVGGWVLRCYLVHGFCALI